jgi:catechol 2,3-dioxygenase-like lactoylglutathione lyase family enzyme
MITQVKIVTITVTDQQKSLEFYTEKLGFKVETNQPMDHDKGTRWIELSPPGGGVTVSIFPPHGPDAKAGGSSNIIFTCEDVRKTYEELKERGVQFIQPPTEEFWGIYCIFADPDDNQFVLSSQT